MKQIAEKYPKMWELVALGMFYDRFKYMFQEWGTKKLKGRCLEQLNSQPFYALFGYLILEFFPKHGIEIERVVMPNSENENECGDLYNVWDNKKWVLYKDIKTPEEAIDKAFEILESQEE
jgi:hypothetical protein